MKKAKGESSLAIWLILLSTLDLNTRKRDRIIDPVGGKCLSSLLTGTALTTVHVSTFVAGPGHSVACFSMDISKSFTDLVLIWDTSQAPAEFDTGT